MAGIQPHQLVDIGGGMPTGHVALEHVTKAKKALVDSGLLYKDFSTAQDILDTRKNLLRCTTGLAKLDSFLKGGIKTREFGSGQTWLIALLHFTQQNLRGNIGAAASSGST
jgi:hypothetical protein